MNFLMDEEESDHVEGGIHIEHIYKDTSFWNNCISKSEQFLRHVYSQK